MLNTQYALRVAGIRLGFRGCRTGFWGFGDRRVGDRHIHIGRFDDESEAARAYDRKAFELSGQYASLNFPAENERARRRCC